MIKLTPASFLSAQMPYANVPHPVIRLCLLNLVVVQSSTMEVSANSSGQPMRQMIVPGCHCKADDHLECLVDLVKSEC